MSINTERAALRKAPCDVFFVIIAIDRGFAPTVVVASYVIINFGNVLCSCIVLLALFIACIFAWVVVKKSPTAPFVFNAKSF